MNQTDNHDINMTRRSEVNVPLVEKTNSIPYYFLNTKQTPPRTHICHSDNPIISSQNWRADGSMEHANLKTDDMGSSTITKQNLPLTPVYHSSSKSSGGPYIYPNNKAYRRSSESTKNNEDISVRNLCIGTPISSIKAQKPQTPISGGFLNKFSSFTPYQTPPSSHCVNSNSTPSQVSLNQKMSSSMSTPRKVPLVVLAKENSEMEDNIKIEKVPTVTRKWIQERHQEELSPASNERFPPYIVNRYPTPKKEVNSQSAHCMHYIETDSNKEINQHLTDKYRLSPRGMQLKANNSLHSHSTLIRSRKSTVLSSLSGMSNTSKDPITSSTSSRMSMFGSAQSLRPRIKFTLAPKTSISLMPKINNATRFISPSPKAQNGCTHSVELPNLKDFSFDEKVVSEERPIRCTLNYNKFYQESQTSYDDDDDDDDDDIDAEKNTALHENNICTSIKDYQEQDRVTLTKPKGKHLNLAQQNENFDQPKNCTNHFSFNPKKRRSSLLFEHSIERTDLNPLRNFAPQAPSKSYASHALSNIQNKSISPRISQQETGFTSNSFPLPNKKNEKVNMLNSCGMSPFFNSNFSVTINADEESQISSDLSDGDEDDFFLLIPSTINSPIPQTIQRKESTTNRPERRVISQCSIDSRTKPSKHTPC